MFTHHVHPDGRTMTRQINNAGKTRKFSRQTHDNTSTNAVPGEGQNCFLKHSTWRVHVNVGKSLFHDVQDTSHHRNGVKLFTLLLGRRYDAEHKTCVLQS
jgi:hypothetical protein